MFTKVLIANRGEIAIRIIRACKELKIKTVAVYSEADRESLHVKLADEAYCIGPASSAKSYLHVPSIIAVAQATGAQAIHPGYGFLAENPYFAEMCATWGIKFIGPSSHVIETMGDKAKAKETMKSAGVPVVPGSDGVVSGADEALKIASEIGYPVMVKATAGGGGRGMRIAHNEEDLKNVLALASGEAEASFGNPAVYLEKYIEEPRHIEVQVLADSHGNLIHLGERDCSIQRRHQKILEEAPSAAVDDELRKKLGQAAILAAQAVDYCNAGTVEFLVDKNGNFYFMEMNTRIQVEHPVTEMVTGVDLVQEQIKIAYGDELQYKQENVQPQGWAIECRINAEDPDNNFAPAPGTITNLHLPGGPGIRVDSFIYNGYRVPAHYDSLLAKVLAWAPTRKEAIARMERALQEFTIEGIPTIIPFHLKILDNAFYCRGEVYTNFIQRRL